MSATPKYGALWPESFDALAIEFGCIKRNGKWKDSQGNECGLGLFEHYRNSMRLCWPRHDENRWSNLLLEQFLSNKITAVLGPASSAKTFNAARFALIDYWAFPDITCILISSTDIRGLELRVWGKMKELWQDAVDRFDWLAGSPIDYLHAITTDDISDGDKVRVLNKGIVCIPCLASGRYVGLGKYLGIKQKRLRLIGDECFPSGTLVDTPSGTVPIETISRGDTILNALGPCTVTATSSRIAGSLVTIRLVDGRSITCTEHHPFFTNFGWQKAIDLTPSHYMVSTYEAVQILREGINEKAGIFAADFLQSALLREVDAVGPGLQEKVLHCRTSGEDWALKSYHVFQKAGIESSIQLSDEAEQSNVFEIHPKEGFKNIKRNGTQTKNARWKWNWTNPSGSHVTQDVPGSKKQPANSHSPKIGEWVSNLLQGGFGIHESETRNRSGRNLSLRKKRPGRKENKILAGSWVDSVEIHELPSQQESKNGSNSYRVHNLQVEGHPSYSVNGLLVHNCQLMGPTFLDAISNLGANPDFKAALLGNPIDPMDPLGMAAEPYEGWTAMPEPEKTKVWTTRFPGGRAVNLVGTDSPNNDFPGDRPKFPYLIHKKRIDEVEAFWGKDSLQYFSQAVGVMKSGLLTWRVITMDLCRNHRAFEKAIWATEQRTKIYAIDIAYGGVGGDRCIAGWGEFGADQDGQQILRVNPPVIVPVSIARKEIPEDQIADFVKSDAAENGIPVENIFYDSTGRGTMGSAFARRFGSTTPNPVEFGGRPTRRPVRLDLFINDESRHGEQRHKRCDEHYYDFVTELWFTSRYAIETEQVRELPEDVAREGCQRKYEQTKSNKIAVESKHDPKARERMKESPDKYDWFVTLIEGARRKGFQIQRLGVAFVDSQEDEWDQDIEEFQEITESLMLVHG